MRPLPSMSSTLRPFDGVLLIRVAARAGAHELRLVGERPFGAVGIDSRADVEGTRVQGARDLRVGCVVFEQVLEEIDAGGRRRHLDRVDVAVDPERGLVARRAGGLIGHGEKPDLPAFVAAPDRFDAAQARIFGRERAQHVGELGVAKEVVEDDSGHRGVTAGKKRAVWRRAADVVNVRRRKRIGPQRAARSRITAKPGQMPAYHS